MGKIYLALLLCVCSLPLFGVEILSETTASEATKGQAFYFSKYLSGRDLEKSTMNHWSFGIASSATLDSTGTKTSRTNDFSAQFGWGKYKPWDSNLDVSLSRTPEDALSTLSLDFELGYLKQFSRQSKEDQEQDGEEQFVSNVRFGGKVGVSIFSAGPLPSQRAEQLKANLSARWKVRDWLTTKFTFNYYGYSRNIQNLTNGLNNNIFIGGAIHRLSSALSSLNNWDCSLSFSYYFGESWTVDNYFKYAISAMDNSVNTLIRFGLSYDINRSWGLGASVDQSFASGSATNTAAVTVVYNTN